MAKHQTGAKGGSKRITTDDWRQAEAVLGKLTEALAAQQLSSVLVDSKDAQAEKTITAQLDRLFGGNFSPKPDAALLNALDTPKLSRRMEKLVVRLREFSRAEESKILKQAGSLESTIKQLSSALQQIKLESVSQPRLLKQVRELKEHVDHAKQELKELWQSSPEAWRVLGVKQLAEYASHLKTGRLVRTPYVEEKLHKALKALAESRGIFLHGETGTGKSELARLISQELTGQEPLVVRGYSGISSSEIFGHMSLKASDCERAAELPDKIDQEIAAWQCKHPEASGEETDRAVCRITERMLRASNSTISEYILGAIYKGARDGRVVLIDEANFIPPGLDAKNNDILTKEPGEDISIPEDGIDPIKNKRVAIVKTGNININPEDPRYMGRFDPGPDQQERIIFIEYNFLPQAIDGQPAVHEFGDKQLFAIAIATLLSGQEFFESENGFSRFRPHLQPKEGSGLLADGPLTSLEPLRLPEGAVEKLWLLSQYAAVTQRVFSGELGQEGDAWALQMEGGVPLSVRTKRMISPRGLIRIVKAWIHDGFETELDHFVFEHLIEGSLDHRQKAYFYQLGQKCGFFKNEGWEQNPDYSQRGLLAHFSVRSPERSSEELRLFSTEEVLEALFGPPPERTSWPTRAAAAGAVEEKRAAGHEVISAFNAFAEHLEECHNLVKSRPVLMQPLAQEPEADFIRRRDFIQMWEFPDKALQYFIAKEKVSLEEFIRACRENLDPDSAGARLLARSGLLDSLT